MNEPMDLKESYERIEWQIKHDVDNYDKDPTIAGIIDLERIKESIDELQSYKDKEDKLREILPLDLAIYFHETYERLAPSFGYETREETRQFDNNSKNGMLMVAVCEVVLNKLLQILNDKGVE